METKLCTRCGIEKPITEFGRNITKKDGLQSACKTCRKEICKAYYYTHKSTIRENARKHLLKIKEFINKVKEKGCIICKEKDPACLDFHHLCDKNFTIAAEVKNTSKSKLEKEIEKCIILCSNCHRKLHFYKMDLQELEQYVSSNVAA